MAHVTNGRDSRAKYLGVKMYEGEIVKPDRSSLNKEEQSLSLGKMFLLAKILLYIQKLSVK
jgi:hypothetical protein